MRRGLTILTLTACLLTAGGAVALADTFVGGDGDDALNGTAGADQLYGELGGVGNDRAVGGEGDDTVYADPIDILKGCEKVVFDAPPKRGDRVKPSVR